jgi:hypothetical protein
MAAGVGVGECVALRGVIATSDLTAPEADPKMQPRCAGRQAILTAGDAVRKLGNLDA